MNINESGKGQEFYKNGRKQFEGEYLNGKRWKGKGYDIQGKLIYKINYGAGKVKEYDYNDELIFDGEYINVKSWSGKGKEINYDDKLVFDGENMKGKNGMEK